MSSNQQSPPFSGVSLKLVLRFGVPKDVAKAKMVCKTWRDDLTAPATLCTNNNTAEENQQQPAAGVVDDTEAVWKQAVTNSHPGVVKVLTDATKSASEEGEEQQDQKPPPLDYRRLAEGLNRKRKQPEPPEPTFRMENLLIIIDLKREVKFKSADGEEKVYIEQLGTYPIEDCSPLLEDFEMLVEVNEGKVQERPLTLKGRNVLCPEVHDNLLQWGEAWRKFRNSIDDALQDRQITHWAGHFCPLHLASMAAITEKQLLVSMHMFRRDDWRKVTLFEEKPATMLNYIGGGRSVPSENETIVAGVKHKLWDEGDACPFAFNSAGAYARDVYGEQPERELLQVGIFLDFEAVLPERHSEDEPKWLREVRTPWFQNVDWTESEDEEISKLKSIDFRLKSVSAYLLEDLEEEQDVLLLLEALDWQ